MGALIGVGAGVAYAAVLLFAARHFFRRWRISEAQRRLCPECKDKYDACDACQKQLPWWHAVWSGLFLGYLEALPDGAVALAAVLCGLLWPLCLPIYGAYRFVTGSAPLAPRELEAQVRKRDKRVRELEEELDSKLNAGA